MLKQITSVQNPLIKHLVKLRKNTDYRHEHKSLVIEGIKLVQEICARLPPKTLLVSDESLIPEGIRADNIFVVSEDVMQKTSGMESPEGILAEVPMPKPDPLQNKRYIIALDRISDPGNLGTLLRTALALGWEGAFILDEGCDPYNEKALRAARGATFHLPLATGRWKDLQNIIKKNQLTPVAADLKGKDIKGFGHKGGVLLVLGNEAQGISAEAKEICEKVTIPMPGEMESLNVSVAGGILMYSLIQK